MRFRIWAQIAVVIAVNLVLLCGLGTAILVRQTQSGTGSFLYSAARERILCGLSVAD